MAIVATPGASNANSYVTLIETDTYMDSRLNTSSWHDSVLQEEALLQACFRLDQYDYVGDPVTETQSLKWPRTLGGITQVETATVVGTITGSGNATVVLTAAGMTGSPITLSVAVLNLDTATQVAGKIRTALNANTVIAAYFTIGGSGAEITLTRTAGAANDDTLSLSVDNGTCTGLTPALTSADTTEGEAGDLIRNYATNLIPIPIKNAQCELALALLAAGGEAAAAGTISSLKIGHSVEIGYASGSSGEFVDTSVDSSGLPIQAARFLKGLRLVNVLA